eukprot:TRINITY_DN3416_c0_g1_i1.p1 TRINITY_DN3416_c0_g1~~TRINITY_DN3416_c0_g1_i1.p1  ORF type:complete len:281 (-),score=40.44 TRINITY_DN3416_c0_g1_i1:152-994(-)
MRTVDYSYKYQIVLPEAGQKTTRIEMLYLDHNRLASVPEALQFPCLWSSLKILLLHSNKLTSLPAEIGSLRTLSVLHLYDNLLTSLPQEITRLVNLQVLYLNDNQLESLPREMSNLTRLQKFTLHRNNLDYLESTILPIVDHLQVSLEGNPLMEASYPTPADDYFFAGDPPVRIPSLMVWCRRGISSFEEDQLMTKFDPSLLPEDLLLFLAEKKVTCSNCSASYFPDEGPSLMMFAMIQDIWVPFKYFVCSMQCAQDSIARWRPPKMPTTPNIHRIRSDS